MTRLFYCTLACSLADHIEEKEEAIAVINTRMTYLSDTLEGDYIFGNSPTVADFYLFIMILWAERFSVAISDRLAALRDRLKARPAVQATMSAEGIL